MKKIVLFFLLAQCVPAFSQKYFTKTAIINFKAGTALEDIDATNKTVTAIFDVSTGVIEVAALQKGFEFRRALMQEHYNENYMESDKFPKAVFKGKFADITRVDFKSNGSYPAVVSGTLEMHGQKKGIDVPVTIKVAGGVVSSTASFSVQLKDFNVKVPEVVRDKISDTVEIKLDCIYKVM